MKKVFIHIGMPKCGSTTLQEFCAHNREALQNKGIFYPTALNGWPQHAELTLGFNRDLARIATFNLPHDYYTQSFQDSACPMLLLSSEFFGVEPMSTCDFISKKYDTTYIVYFRSPLPCAQSLLLQDVVNYNFHRIADWPRLFNVENYISYVRHQLNFLDWFCGGDLNSADFIIKSFDMCVKSGRFEEDFCETLGITDTNNLQKIPQQNTALHMDYSLFYAHCNVLPLSRDVLWSIEAQLRSLSAADTQAQKYRLFSKKQIASIPQDIIDRYTELGDRMGDPDFWQRGVDELLKLEECPYRQLPEDRQWEIFEKLSPESQENIRKVWPHEEYFSSVVRRTGFLPDIPEDEKSAFLMRRWTMAYGQLALRHDSLHSELTDLAKAKKSLESQLSEYSREDSLYSRELVDVQEQCSLLSAQIHELFKFREEAQQSKCTIAALHKEISELRHSKSWMVTAPLRKVHELLNK